jgi:excisionase family DNA binding protein
VQKSESYFLLLYNLDTIIVLILIRLKFMENIIFSQLSLQELRSLIRDEMQNAVKQCVPINETQDIPTYMNIEETARLLGLAVPSIYGLVHRRQIPHIKKGRYLKFKRNEIIAWLESGRKKTQAEIYAEAQKYIHRKRI